VLYLAISANAANQVISCSADGLINVWDAVTNTCVASSNANTDKGDDEDNNITAVVQAYSHHGSPSLYLASEDLSIKEWFL
jgi:WD40 repeat protein